MFVKPWPNCISGLSVLRRTSSIFTPMNSLSCKVGVFDDSVIDDIDDKIWSLHGIFVKYLCHFIPNRNIPCLLHRTSNLIQKTGGKNKLGGLQENSATLSASDHSYVKISILSIHFPSDMPNIQHDLHMDDISYLKWNLKSILMARTKKKLCGAQYCPICKNYYRDILLTNLLWWWPLRSGHIPSIQIKWGLAAFHKIVTLHPAFI